MTKQLVPNVKLQRLMSEADMTQQRLADLLNARVEQSGGKPGRYTDETIRRYLRGERTWPNPRYRAAFRHVFNVESDQDVGFHDQRSPVVLVSDLLEEEPVRRSDFFRVALGTAAAFAASVPLRELTVVTQPTPVPSLVGKTEIQQVLNTAQVFSTWDNTYGGGLVREAVAAQLTYAVELLNARCSANNRADLYTAVGFLGHTSAWMAFDAFAHDDARRMMRLALTCAEQAGDPHLRAEVLTRMARQAIWCGDPDTGLTFAELALVRADMLTATERANIHTVRARALAKLQRVDDAVRAIGEADDEFSDSRPENDPIWMGYYDVAQHGGDTGHALYDLAIRGRFVSEARCRLQTAVDGHGDNYVRSRAFARLKLASLVMATGEPEEAAVIGQAAVSDASHVRSQRAGWYLRELNGLAAPHRRLDGVADLRQRLGGIAAV
ncbi:XRE family transcriptional regulator [Nocardia sp. NBC_00508]|uniref:XRE family transcriptional regulator n=1 Tax=Nocardia sp. NBC_00508 TaxID=2975992 RepID=UPI002E81C2EC|nr:XRE family transcriptional regulator [Nocardia sp. NBC_00508]WUD66179.1 XRE family transcriptional regulator [Nocardia sp. NBC_00508]